jgi:signal transduction histidine kinase
VHAALDDLRELAHGIYPPLLVERGLADAVRAALRRSGVRGRVEGDGVGRYSPDAEATVYFCCVEAIQNAAKHAPGATVDVRLWREPGALYFAVSDDGPGFDPASAPEGVGVTNMRDRVGALGGSLQLDGQPQAGTRVTGALPLVIDSAPPDTAALP